MVSFCFSVAGMLNDVDTPKAHISLFENLFTKRKKGDRISVNDVSDFLFLQMVRLFYGVDRCNQKLADSSSIIFVFDNEGIIIQVKNSCLQGRVGTVFQSNCFYLSGDCLNFLF